MTSRSLKNQKPYGRTTAAHCASANHAKDPGGRKAGEIDRAKSKAAAITSGTYRVTPSGIAAMRSIGERKSQAPIRPELAAIAVEHLGEQFSILEPRGRDALDFHDASVIGVRDALEAAFELGRMTPARSTAIAELIEVLEQGMSTSGAVAVANGVKIRQLIKAVRS